MQKEKFNIYNDLKRWLATDESPTSGAVTLEIEMPSGYWVVQSDAEKVLTVPDFHFLRDVITGSDKIVWTMDKVQFEKRYLI